VGDEVGRLDVGDLVVEVEVTLRVGAEVVVGDRVGFLEGLGVVGGWDGAMEVEVEEEAGLVGDWDGAAESELRRHKLLRESSSESRSAVVSVFNQS